MSLSWSPKLALGVTRVDAQHRRLFERANALLAALGSGNGEGEVRRLATFLNDYVIRHFQDEERIMREHGYPEYPAHRRLHDTFAAGLADIGARLAKKADTALVLEIHEYTCRWLIEHIGGADRAIARFLARRSPSRTSS